MCSPSFWPFFRLRLVLLVAHSCANSIDMHGGKHFVVEKFCRWFGLRKFFIAKIFPAKLSLHENFPIYSISISVVLCVHVYIQTMLSYTRIGL